MALAKKAGILIHRVGAWVLWAPAEGLREVRAVLEDPAGHAFVVFAPR